MIGHTERIVFNFTSHPIGYGGVIVEKKEQRKEDKKDKNKEGGIARRCHLRGLAWKIGRNTPPICVCFLPIWVWYVCCRAAICVMAVQFIEHHIFRGLINCFHNLIEVHLTKLIAVAVRVLCTPTVNLAKYVNKRMKHLGQRGVNNTPAVIERGKVACLSYLVNNYTVTKQ